MDYVWGPHTAARVGYALEQAAGSRANIAAVYGHHSAWGARVAYGYCAIHTALDLGKKLDVDVSSMVKAIEKRVYAHAIPTIDQTCVWGDFTSCRLMWKMDTIRPFIYSVTGAYCGVAPPHAGVAQFPTLGELSRAVMARAGHSFHPYDAFRYATLSYKAMAAVAALCRLPLPKADKYARYIYRAGDTPERFGSGE